MVKKTLLSLAIAASTASLIGCNISSVDTHNNDIDLTAVEAGADNAAGPIASFSPGRSVVPTSIDLLFAAAPATDGTASTADTTPPVTTAINDLTGFSATASIDIPFSARLDDATIPGNVHIIKLLNKDDDSTIDALDLASIANVNPTNPIDAAGSPRYGDDFVAQYVEMDNGATPTIRLHLKKPLESKSKYIIAVTSGIKDPNGTSVRSSSAYSTFVENRPLYSEALAPVGAAVRAWHGIATGFENNIASVMTRDANDVVLSYAFTTEAKEDVLLAMAAPENYIFGLLGDTATMEKLLIGDDDPEDPANAVNQLVAGAALILNVGGASFDPLNLSDADRRAIRLSSQYKTLISNTLAKAIINGGAAKSAVDGLQAGGMSAAQIQGAIDAWNGASGNEAKQIDANPANWDAAQKGYLAQALGQYDDSTTNDDLVATAANGAGALLKDAAKRPAPRDVTMIAGTSGVIGISNTILDLPASTVTQQGMIKLPQFMKRKTVDGASFWKGSASVGAVIDAALGNEAGKTPPKDDDGSLNVSYRFPFAQYVEDVAVPVLVTYPTDPTCVTNKPEDGWKTIIFQHGITTDRTASLGFANQMAAPTAGCYATVAIDMVAHGVDASTTDRNGNPIRYSAFNGFNVAGYVDGANTPFASTLAGLAANDDTTFAGLAERHENLATNSQNQVVPMSFVPDAESGNSGDLFINLTNFQQSRDHLRQSVMDLLNLNASIENFDDLDPDNVYFVGHSLGAMVGMTFVAVNNAVANNANILSKDVNPIKAAVFGNPGGQIPKLLENSPQFSTRILPGLAASGLTQGTTNLEKYFSILQATLDTVDPVNFVELLKETDTPVLMFEMVGGGAISAQDQNTDSALGPVTGLSDQLIQAVNAGALPGYPADTVVPNNANPSLNGVETGVSHLAGTDPLVTLLELTPVAATSADQTVPGDMLVSRFSQGTHGTLSSADAVTVFAELIKQSASFFGSGGAGVIVGDPSKLATE